MMKKARRGEYKKKIKLSLKSQKNSKQKQKKKKKKKRLSGEKGQKELKTSGKEGQKTNWAGIPQKKRGNKNPGPGGKRVMNRRKMETTKGR